ncbi:dyp-type peroxidase [Pleurotus djamor]|nr:dyp-type peroxidase [Pleurotus djamor]
MTEIDFTNIQGDILQGLPKKTQVFLFYRFTDQGALRFRRRLHEIIPLIKTAEQVILDRSNIRAHKEAGNAQLLPVSAVNIAFSQAGLKVMDLDEQFEHEVDEPFDIGQLADAPFLNDLDTSEWEPAFNDPTKLVHLLIFIAGDSRDSVQAEVSQLEQKLSIAEDAEPALLEVLRLWGDVRPGDQAGHEHFGYLDGISNPSIEGVPPTPNSSPPFPRSFLLFGEGDPGPSWAVDGSFLVFRYLKQLVPEFDEFLERNALLIGYDGEDGAPVDLSPLKDDPSLAL